jgi:hypothetical protein
VGRSKTIQAAVIFGASLENCTGRSSSARRVEELDEASKNWAGRLKSIQAAVILGASP